MKVNEPIKRKPITLTNRRNVIAGAAVACLSLSVPARGKTRENDKDLSAEQKTRTYVLVHGAWHGGWCWRDVAAPLRACGHRVFTPTLAGLADRKHLLTPTTGLDTHIEDITSLIEYYGLTDITLVGHSYGGMVIAGVADAMKDRISHIVYLDAALPKDGDTMISQGPIQTADELAASEQALRALAPDGIAMQAFPPEVLGIPADHPSYSWVAEKLTPHPLKTWLDPIHLKNDGPSGLRKIYIHCTNPVLPNSSFAWHASQIEQNEEWSYHALKTGHDAMITAPKELVDLLI